MCSCGPRTFWSQFRLLLWKNWLLKRRRATTTFFEIFVPMCAFFILMLIRGLVDIDDVAQSNNFSSISIPAVDVSPMSAALACGDFYQQSFAHDRYGWEAIAIVDKSGNKEFSNNLISFLKTSLLTSITATNSSLVHCLHYDVTTVSTKGGMINITDYILRDQNDENGFALFHPVDTVDELNDWLGQDDYGVDEKIQTLAFALIFEESNVAANKFSYTIRVNSSDIPFTGEKVNDLQVGFSRDQWGMYHINHVTTLQQLVDTYIINSAGNTFFPPKLPLVDFSPAFVPFPTAAHKQDNFGSVFGSLFGLFLVLAFLWPFSRFVRNMVEEKERKLKETMKIMGLKNSVFWASWIVTYLILFFILVLVVCIVTKSSLFPHSDFSLIFIFFFFFCLSLLSLACALTTFFDRAKTAGTVSPLFLIILYLPFIAVNDPQKDQNLKNFASLLSPVAFSLGATTILKFESAFIGVQWSNTNVVVDNYTFGGAVALMLFDSVLYALIAWYADQVYPSEYGTHRPVYFLFTLSYWKSWFECCKAKPRSSAWLEFDESPSLRARNKNRINNQSDEPLLSSSVEDDGFTFNEDYESVPESMSERLGIKLRSLRKQFDGTEKEKPFVAVDSLDLNLYAGQIFVLLGHNGAGKTTTINMLTGMMPPSSGSANIYGRDLVGDLDSIRHFLGYCPQHDCLFDDLTVEEHLQFFACLKGTRPDKVNDMTKQSIDEIQMQQKKKVASSSLSGGQKRRLSMAIALIGNSKVIFLDEPSSGVDPASRVAIHNFLMKKKEGRIIILTTHFMDEADLLGDRVGILHHGQMKVCGSSLFLKRMFGVGYNLTFIKKSNESNSESNKMIATSVKSRIPTAEIISEIGTELTFRLPLTSSTVFPDLFGELDTSADRFKFTNYGLSVTTLEEVFLRIAQEARADEEEEKKKEQLGIASDSHAHHHHEHNSNAPLIDPTPIDQELTTNSDGSSAMKREKYFSRHFRALIKKRWDITKRDRKAAICQFLVPLILLVMGLGLLRVPPDFDFPNIILNPVDQYNLPLQVPVNSLFWSTANSMDHFPEFQGKVISEFVSESETLMQFSDEILNLRLTSDQGLSHYGAFSFHVFNTSVLDRSKFTDPEWIIVNRIAVDPQFFYYIWVNITADHGLPTFLNTASNIFFKNVTKKLDASIETRVHPFSFTAAQKQFLQSVNGVFASIVISIAFSFVPASYAVFVVSEREFKSKHLQIISGVSTLSYWLSNFVWDFISFLIPTSLAAIIIAVYSNPNFVGENFFPVILLFLFYGLSVIPFTYCFTFLFKSHSTAQNVMILVYLVGGVVLTMVDFALHTISSTKDANDKYIRFLFRLIPNYCLGDGIFYLSLRQYLNKGPYDLYITGYDILFMAGGAVFYFCLALLIEWGSNIPSIAGLFKKDPQMLDEMAPEDPDCAAERIRLQTNMASNIGRGNLQSDAESASIEQDRDIIRIEGLRKIYPGKSAVKDLWIGVPVGQIFGFLGVNGAGKSTTLKMLTGDELPSAGSAHLAGFDIATQAEEARSSVGLCPQFDALHETLTAVETLEFYGRLRGIPEAKLPAMVNYLIDRLTLTQYKDRVAGKYSGGNKRKLSLAVALIGDPKVVLLDEITTGVDVSARKFIWKFLLETMQHRAVVLTTHSMEECEALCQRIGIIVSGQLRCLGSSQHLKSRFGSGFQIEISSAGNDPAVIQHFMHQEFGKRPGCKLTEIEVYGSKLKYKVEEDSLKLRTLFSIIESHRVQIGISDYSIGQTTLEQIFIQFAKLGDDQNEMNGDAIPRAPTVFVSPALQIAGGLTNRQGEMNQPPQV